MADPSPTAREEVNAVRDLIILTVVANSVLLFGAVLMRSHVLAWRRQSADPQLEEDERRFYYRQYRRRMQASGLVALLGLLLNLLNEHLLGWALAPLWFALYVCLLLGILVWIILLACGDGVSSHLHNRVALNRIRHKQQLLEASLAQFREQQRKPGGQADA
jgi:hypothetical protein